MRTKGLLGSRSWVLGAAIALVLSGCGGGSDSGSDGSIAPGTTTASEGSVPAGSPAVVTDTVDALFAALGPPDAFTRKVVVLEDRDSTVDSVVYAELAQRFDAVDGIVVGSEDIEAFPDGTILPLSYSFFDVGIGMTEQEVRDSLAEVELVETEGTLLDLPPGSNVLAGSQIMVGLQDDQVVYVQTFPLVPDESGELQAYLEGSEP
ncbi:MAG: hypothetical protein MUE78_00390 [Ilumatobacteraceae bacterium]|nr:hypothetical protein [Ilumatobacteraceae bacterium]